jgi:hypothetical protein
MFVAGKFLVNSLRSGAKTIGVMVVAFIGQVLSAIARSCNNQVPASVYAAVIAEEAQQFVRDRQGALDIKVRSGSGPHAIRLESDESSEVLCNEADRVDFSRGAVRAPSRNREAASESRILIP